jgi:hypothetical protein
MIFVTMVTAYQPPNSLPTPRNRCLYQQITSIHRVITAYAKELLPTPTNRLLHQKMAISIAIIATSTIFGHLLLIKGVCDAREPPKAYL